jgi:putative RecB family exonuclease
VEYELTDMHLRGRIDRIEVQPDGSWVLTDYKTGRVPGESREYAASFGLRFYALVCWRAFQVVPAEIRLMYLSDPAILTFNPTKQMLVAFELQMQALARAIKRAADNDDWRTRPSPLCMTCPSAHRGHTRPRKLRTPKLGARRPTSVSRRGVVSLRQPHGGTRRM